MLGRLRRVHPALILAALDTFGLSVASYLSIVELSGGVPVCGPLHGCETVATSVYARIGGIPVAVFGVIFLFMALNMAVGLVGRLALDVGYRGSARIPLRPSLCLTVAEAEILENSGQSPFHTV